MISYTKGSAPARLTALAATPGMTWSSLGAADRAPIREALLRITYSGSCAQSPDRLHDARRDIERQPV